MGKSKKKPTSKLPVRDGVRSCPKCGLSWERDKCARPALMYRVDGSGGDHFCRACMDCGYQWLKQIGPPNKGEK